jgi:hypothetical protein
MNQQQILEQFLNFSMQQHAVKDQEIDGLKKQVADLQKQLAETISKE